MSAHFHLVIPPFGKRGQGGFDGAARREAAGIPLTPPFAKGEAIRTDRMGHG